MSARFGIALTLLLGHAAAGQSPVADSSMVDRTSRSGAEIWAGYSPGSTRAGVLGRHEGITLGLFALRFNRRVSVSERRVIYYTFDVIPAARVTPLIVYTTSSGL